MKLQGSNFLSLEQVQGQYLSKGNPTVKTQNTPQTSFQKYLDAASEKQQTPKTQVGEVKFSKHAASRLSSRNINLSENQLQRLKEGTKKAEEKGINDSLVMIDSLAFIVNVKSGTVVTAMDQTETKENIFTNIDGAVIV